MRVCHIIEAASGGSGQIALDLARAGCEAGDEVTVIFSPERAQKSFVEALHRIPQIETISIPMYRKMGWRDLISALRLWFVLFKHRPFDIIHSHSSKAGGLARIAGFFLPFRCVQIYSPHAFITMAPKCPIVYFWIEKILSHFCDAIITVSPQEEKHARERLHLPERKIKMVPNGINLSKYPRSRDAVRRELGVSDNEFVIGFVGRLEEQKNPLRLAETFCLISKKLPSSKLVVIGDGALRGEIDKTLEKLGVKSKTQFLGEQNACKYMPAFDCFLCTSDYESFGLVIVEALAAGVPVVTTPVGIAEEAIIDGKNGYIADFVPSALAEAVLKIASLSEEERKRMAEEARNQAKRFDLNFMVKETFSLYKELFTAKRISK